MGEDKETSIYDRVATAFEEMQNGEEQPEAVDMTEQGTEVEQTEEPVATEPSTAEPEQPVTQAQEVQPMVQEQNGQNGLLEQAMNLIRSQNQRLAQLEEALKQSQSAVQQQSQMAESTIESSMAQPAVEVQIPVLDMYELQYKTPEEQNAELGAWQTAMVDAISKRVAEQYRSQLEPIKQDYETKQRLAANEAAKAQIANNPMFSDFRANEGAIEAFLEQNPELAGMDAGKRYALGALAVRGRNYDPNAKPSDEQIVEMLMSSPSAQKMLDTRRAQAVQQKNAEIPTVLPSSGYSSSAAIRKPDVAKDKDELLARIRQGLFGNNV